MSGAPTGAGPGPWFLAVLAGASCMVGLDLGAVGVALPAVAKYFGVGLAHASKVLVVYRLVATCLVLVAGALGARLGYRRTLLTGTVVFTGGSLLCGLAPGMTELIAGRAVQGVGGALMTANALALTAQAVPKERRGHALGIISLFTALGFSAGPTLGGLITHYLSWRLIFLLNLPLGAALVLAGLRVLPPAPAVPARRGLDLIGAAQLAAGLYLLISALDLGKAHGALDPRCWLALGGGLLCLAGFWLWERQSPHPLAEWSMLKGRAYLAGLAMAFFLGAFSAGGAFMLPFYLEDGRHLGAHLAGLLLALPPLATLGLGPWLGRWADALGSRPLCLTGGACLTLAALVFATVDQTTALGLVAGGLLLTGLGLPAARIAGTRLCLSHAPEGGHGAASGLLRLATGLGSLTGVVFMEHLFSIGLPSALTRNDVNFAQAGLAPELVLAAFRHAFTLSLGLALAVLACALAARDYSVPAPSSSHR